MPQESIIGRMQRMSEGLKILLPVTGFIPPFASVAAIIDMPFVLEVIEQI